MAVPGVDYFPSPTEAHLPNCTAPLSPLDTMMADDDLPSPPDTATTPSDGLPSSPPSCPPSPNVSTDGLSIYDILRRYPRERLYAPPTEWTSRQLEVLNISFQEPPVLLPGSPDPAPCENPKCKKRSRDAEWLEAGKSNPVTVNLMLGTTYSGRLPFYFNYRSNTGKSKLLYLECASFHKLETKFPIASLLGSAAANEMRFKKLGDWRSFHGNRPLRHLFALRRGLLRPENRLRDPLVAALLIALAQAQDAHDPQEPGSSRIFQPHVLFIENGLERSNYLHLFSADIPFAFLELFDNPSKPHSPAHWTPISIRHTMIPYKPYETFRHRLFDALGLEPLEEDE